MKNFTGKILLGLFTASLIGFGGHNVYTAIRYRTYPMTTLAETPANSLPTFVTLKDLTFDVDHLLKLKLGDSILYIPVRARGADPKSPYSVVIFTSAPELIAAATSESADALKHLAALARRTEVTGRVTGTERDIKRLRETLPSISPTAVIISEGATPAPIQGSIMVVVGILLVFGLLGKPVPPPTSDATKAE